MFLYIGNQQILDIIKHTTDEMDKLLCYYALLNLITNETLNNIVKNNPTFLTLLDEMK